MKIITITAKGEAKHEGKVLETFTVQRDVPKADDFEELCNVINHQDIYDGYYKSEVIDIQADMRRSAIAEILAKHGIVKTTRRVVPPEVQAIEDAIKSLPAEKQAEARKKVQALLSTM